MPKSEQPPVGIDLGTTYSVVAYLDASGRPTTVLNGVGDLLTPSAVAFEEGNVIVGKEAIKGSVLEPARFADCFKRDMGRPNFRREVTAQQVPPEVLSAFLLERLKQDAERRLGAVRQVVITVPAFFDETRRKATQDAGRLAGLDVLDIINEPTAAAIAYGYNRALLAGAASSQPAEKILVYDLGGGTFDVTILEIAGDTFRTLATDGDVQLGGKDFDERLVNHIAEKFLAAHAIDPRSDGADAAQLWLDAQEAKHALTERMKTTVVCFHAGIRMRVEITRQDFEEMSRDLLERTKSTTVQVLRQAKLDWPALNRILLVGGSTRMPMVIDMLRQLSGRQPDQSQSADEVVAHGAALYAGLILSKTGGSRPAGAHFELVNVNSHSLGVVGLDPKTKRKVNVVLIPKNTPLPCRSVKQFKTARPNQDSVKVSVIEGEHALPEYCIALGECVVRDLPPGLPEGSPVEVEYQYAANGRISVLARVTRSRQSAQVEIQHANARPLEDLATWRSRLCNEPAAPVGGGSDDRAGLIRKLDDLYVRAGTLLAEQSLPPPFHKSQQAVRAAAEEVHLAKALLRHAESARASAIGPQESARHVSEVAQARQALLIGEAKLRGTCLVFGRDCAAADLWPPSMDRDKPEMLRLRLLV